MVLEEHNVLRSMRAGFCVYDSRGFGYKDPIDETLLELSQWANEGVQHNQICYRSGDEFPVGPTSTSRRFARRQVNCAMLVGNMADLYDSLKGGDSSPLEATKAVFCYSALKRGSK